MADVDVKINRAKLQEIGMKASHETTNRAAKVTARRVRSFITTDGLVQTGSMRRSIKIRDLGPYTKEIYSTVEHTAWQNWGAASHIIVPKNPKGLLVFYWERFDTIVGFKKVNHPGITGAKFYERALNRLTLKDFTG